MPNLLDAQSGFPDFAKAVNGDKIVELIKAGTAPPFLKQNRSIHLKTLEKTFSSQTFTFEIYFEHQGVLYALAEGSGQYPIYHFTPSFAGIYYVRAETNGCATYIKFDESQELNTYQDNCLN